MAGPAAASLPRAGAAPWWAAGQGGSRGRPQPRWGFLPLLFEGLSTNRVPGAPSWLPSHRRGWGRDRVRRAEAAMPGETSQLETQRGRAGLRITFFLLALLPKGGKKAAKNQTAKKRERFLQKE